MAKKTQIKTAFSLQDLNTQQKDAIVCTNDRVLVLAGAGSGKTRTLLQKMMYLVQEKQVDPTEIMAITFTKNAANEMIDRLLLAVDTDNYYAGVLENKKLSSTQKKNIRLQKVRENKWISKLTIRTFHSLCYSIMKNFGAKEFDNKFKLLTDASEDNDPEINKLSAAETQYEVLYKMLIKCCENKAYLLQFKRFIIDYMVDRLHIDTKQHMERFPSGKFYTSLRGEKVRSKSEQYICDWLYRHSIQYVYEPDVQFVDFAFTPDFFIPEANIYLEHISNLSAAMANKEKEFIKGGKVLVQTFESMTHDTNLFNLALNRIIKGRLPSNYQVETVLLYEEEMRGRNKEVRDFLRQVVRVLDMLQVDQIDPIILLKKIENENHERVRLFYQSCMPIIENYHKYCVDKSYLDFNHLVDRCISLINTQSDVKELLHAKYKFVLVDEFQDVNRIQIKLIKSIMNPKSQLFCVGDDWQSIYGFRGSDVRYIVDFNKYFKDSSTFQLNTNYRSTNSIVKASNEVIAHNKYKVDKEIKSANKSKKKIEVYSGVDHADCVQFAVQEVKDLIKKGILEEDILFLYRRSKMFEPYKAQLKKQNLKVIGRTIHSAKGLEAKIVFIIGLTDGSGGFPDIWMEDRIYQLVRPSRHDILIEEERRLFYVAITRAREVLYLITEIGNMSCFIKEIPENYKILYSSPLNLDTKSINKCPECNFRVESLYKFCPYCGAKI